MNSNVLFWINIVQYIQEAKRRGNLVNLKLTVDSVQAPVFIKELIQTYIFSLEKTKVSTGFKYELSVVVNGVKAICFVHFDGLMVDSPVCLSIQEFNCLVKSLESKASLEDKVKILEKRIFELERENKTLFSEKESLAERMKKIKSLL
jgi:hypothetical protein